MIIISTKNNNNGIKEFKEKVLEKIK